MWQCLSKKTPGIDRLWVLSLDPGGYPHSMAGVIPMFTS